MRFAAPTLPLTLLLTFALGCGADSSDPKKTDPKGLVGKSALPDAPGTPADPKAAAQKFVTDFLTAVKAQKATADQLTADFKKAVAPPLASDDAAKGYSDLRAADYLVKWATVTADEPKVELAGDVAFAAGKPGPGGRLLMRLAKDGGAWKVDWLSNGPTSATDVKLDGGEDTAGVQFTVAAFTDAALKKDYILAAGLVAPDARARMAPPFKADEALGFSRSLFQRKVEAEFGPADRAVVAGTNRSGTAATVTVDLAAAMTKTALEVKLSKGTKPGAWLVAGFDAK